MAKIEESSSRQGFGENVTNLIVSGDKVNTKLANSDLFTYKVVVKLNILCASMKHGVGEEINGANVITLENWWTRLWNAKFKKQTLKPY